MDMFKLSRGVMPMMVMVIPYSESFFSFFRKGQELRNFVNKIRGRYEAQRKALQGSCRDRLLKISVTIAKVEQDEGDREPSTMFAHPFSTSDRIK
mmetsp:Transcript_15682/g.40248  ORF Transcript_15682/g.40248 Transcript_15682/m.40248 type:complete len:95 (+) Transcript_15682:445-729(+)